MDVPDNQMDLFTSLLEDLLEPERGLPERDVPPPRVDILERPMSTSEQFGCLSSGRSTSGTASGLSLARGPAISPQPSGMLTTKASQGKLRCAGDACALISSSGISSARFLLWIASLHRFCRWHPDRQEARPHRHRAGAGAGEEGKRSAVCRARLHGVLAAKSAR